MNTTSDLIIKFLQIKYQTKDVIENFKMVLKSSIFQNQAKF